MPKRMWIKAALGKTYMVWGAIIALYAAIRAVSTYGRLTRFIVEPSSIPGVSLSLVFLFTVVLAAIVGPGLFIFGLVNYLYHSGGDEAEQLSVKVHKGKRAGKIMILSSEGIRLGDDSEGQPFVTESVTNTPEEYWLITYEKDSWLLVNIGSQLIVEVNGQPISEATLQPGDRLQTNDLLIVFDTVASNKALQFE